MPHVVCKGNYAYAQAINSILLYKSDDTVQGQMMKHPESEIEPIL